MTDDDPDPWSTTVEVEIDDVGPSEDMPPDPGTPDFVVGGNEFSGVIAEHSGHPFAIVSLPLHAKPGDLGEGVVRIAATEVVELVSMAAMAINLADMLLDTKNDIAPYDDERYERAKGNLRRASEALGQGIAKRGILQ